MKNNATQASALPRKVFQYTRNAVNFCVLEFLENNLKYLKKTFVRISSIPTLHRKQFYFYFLKLVMSVGDMY